MATLRTYMVIYMYAYVINLVIIQWSCCLLRVWASNTGIVVSNPVPTMNLYIPVFVCWKRPCDASVPRPGSSTERVREED
jgi:hypothetical protein